MRNAVSMMLMTVALVLSACERAPDLPATPHARSYTAKDLPPETELVRNMEQVPYCLPIPKGEYARDDNADLPRGTLAFVHKVRKDDSITISGLHRTDPTVKIADHFRNSYARAEESGKIIEKKELHEARGLYFATGYWSNKIYEQRFVEITWLRKDDVVVYTATHGLSEKALWSAQLANLLRYDSTCK